MKTFLVTRPEGDARAWIQFAESQKAIEDGNESGFPLRIVEIPISVHDSLLLFRIACIASQDFSAILGNLIRETSKVSSAEGIHLDRIQKHF